MAGLGHDRGFLCRDKALWLCHNSGFCVAIGFGLSRALLGRGRGCSLSCQCRDKGPLVVTETVTTRGHVATGFVLAGDFYVATENRQD